MLKIIIINLVSDEAQNSLIIVYSETQAPTREESTRAQSTLLAVAVLWHCSFHKWLQARQYQEKYILILISHILLWGFMDSIGVMPLCQISQSVFCHLLRSVTLPAQSNSCCLFTPSNLSEVWVLKLRFLVQRYIKQFLFSVMCREHAASPGGFLPGCYESLLQILKQNLSCKVWMLPYFPLKHFGLGFFLLHFVLSLWVIGRPVYMLQAVADSPSTVTFPILASIPLTQKDFIS